MNCPTCGATLTDGTTTCPTCGASISQPADFNQMQYQQPQANYNQPAASGKFQSGTIPAASSKL